MIPRGTAAAGAGEGGEGGEGAGGACGLACGAGQCEMTESGPRCRCGALYAGARCQHYRCAAHCHRRGRCLLDTAQPAPKDQPPPLKVQYTVPSAAAVLAWIMFHCCAVTVSAVVYLIHKTLK